MRWSTNIHDPPRPGDTRICTRFAFLPIQIGNEKRWLEFVHWVERYQADLPDYEDWEGKNVTYSWQRTRFTDNGIEGATGACGRDGTNGKIIKKVILVRK